MLCENQEVEAIVNAPVSPALVALEELKKLKIWVNWDNDKHPLQPNGSPAKANEPITWSTYDAVAKAAAKNPSLGIGIELSNGLCGQDFDHVITNGVVEPWALEEIKKLNTYTEISPSGTGIHCIGKAVLSGKGRKSGRAEIYSEGRYFTFTGNHLEGTPPTINPNQDAAISFYTRISGIDPTAAPKASGLIISQSDFDIFRDALETRTVDALLADDSFTLEVGQGGRHTFLNSVAGYLWDGKRTKGDMTALLRATAERCCSSGTRKITEQEIVGLVEYCMERDPNKPPTVPASDKYKSELLAAQWFQSADAFLAEKIEPKKVLVTDKAGHPVFTSSTINQIFAFRGYGKSLLGLGLVNIMLQGGEMLGYKSEGGLKVLLCDGELPPEDLQKRLNELVGESHGNLYLMSPHNLPHSTFPAMSDPDYQTKFKAQIDELKPDVIVFDTLTACFKFDTNDPDTWILVNQFLMELRMRKICVIITHHAGKNGTQRGRTDGDDNLDLVIKLDAPVGHSAGQGLHFVLSYEKVRAESKLNGFQAVYDGNWEIVADGVFESVVEMFKAGHTYKKIEMTLGISSKTIGIYKKKAIALGLLPPDNLKGLGSSTPDAEVK